MLELPLKPADRLRKLDEVVGFLLSSFDELKPSLLADEDPTVVGRRAGEALSRALAEVL